MLSNALKIAAEIAGLPLIVLLLLLLLLSCLLLPTLTITTFSNYNFESDIHNSCFNRIPGCTRTIREYR